MALLPLSTRQVNNVESLLTKHREFYHSNNSVSGENITTHCPIRRMLNARKCLLNKHLITLNKTVRVTADLLRRKGRLFTAPPGAYCFLFNADKCKSFTVPQQPGVEQLSRKIKLVPYDLFSQRWMRTTSLPRRLQVACCCSTLCNIHLRTSAPLMCCGVLPGPAGAEGAWVGSLPFGFCLSSVLLQKAQPWYTSATVTRPLFLLSHLEEKDHCKERQ